MDEFLHRLEGGDHDRITREMVREMGDQLTMDYFRFVEKRGWRSLLEDGVRYCKRLISESGLRRQILQLLLEKEGMDKYREEIVWTHLDFAGFAWTDFGVFLPSIHPSNLNFIWKSRDRFCVSTRMSEEQLLLLQLHMQKQVISELFLHPPSVRSALKQQRDEYRKMFCNLIFPSLHPNMNVHGILIFFLMEHQWSIMMDSIVPLPFHQPIDSSFLLQHVWSLPFEDWKELLIYHLGSPRNFTSSTAVEEGEEERQCYSKRLLEFSKTIIMRNKFEVWEWILSEGYWNPSHFSDAGDGLLRLSFSSLLKAMIAENRTRLLSLFLNNEIIRDHAVSTLSSMEEEEEEEGDMEEGEEGEGGDPQVRNRRCLPIRSMACLDLLQEKLSDPIVLSTQIVWEVLVRLPLHQQFPFLQSLPVRFPDFSFELLEQDIHYLIFHPITDLAIFDFFESQVNGRFIHQLSLFLQYSSLDVLRWILGHSYYRDKINDTSFTSLHFYETFVFLHDALPRFRLLESHFSFTFYYFDMFMYFSCKHGNAPLLQYIQSLFPSRYILTLFSFHYDQFSSHSFIRKYTLEVDLIQKTEMFSDQALVPECIICLDQQPLQVSYLKTCCNHVYCRPCFVEWLRSSKQMRCAYCRQYISHVVLCCFRESSEYEKKEKEGGAPPHNNNNNILRSKFINRDK